MTTVYILTYTKENDYSNDEDFHYSYSSEQHLKDQARINLTDETITEQKLYKVDLLNNKVTTISIGLENGIIVFKENKI